MGLRVDIVIVVVFVLLLIGGLFLTSIISLDFSPDPDYPIFWRQPYNPDWLKPGGGDDGRGEICTVIHYEGDARICPGDILCTCWNEEGPPWDFWTSRNGACVGPPPEGRICDSWIGGEDSIIDIVLNWQGHRIECPNCCTPDTEVTNQGDCVVLSTVCKSVPGCS